MLFEAEVGLEKILHTHHRAVLERQAITSEEVSQKTPQALSL